MVFGHKLNLTTGKSNLILDVVIEKGNPADSERFIPILKRQENIYHGVPNKTAADGCYASIDNSSSSKPAPHLVPYCSACSDLDSHDSNSNHN